MRNAAAREEMLVYQIMLSAAPTHPPLSKGHLSFVAGVPGILSNFSIWVASWGFREALKTTLKVLSRRRIFFGVVLDQRVVSSGWANLGFCHFYPVERDSVVLGTLWTAPELRGQGLASTAIRQVMGLLY